MDLAAERLVDWRTALSVGARVAGTGPPLTPVERARVAEDFGEIVPEAESIVSDFTLLRSDGARARAWVMTREEWLGANLRAFERVLEPFAQKLLLDRRESALAQVRRHALGAQIGALLGYLGHKVLGQYDLFAPPDDEGVLYFVGPNVVAVERKFHFPEREFRLWVSLHEVTHRVQFAGVPWLRGHLSTLVDAYLGSVEVDPKRLLESLRRAVEQVRRGETEWRGWGWVFLLMTPEQRDLFKRMQAVMALLEGHGTYVMNEVARDRIPTSEDFKRRLHDRRHRRGVEKAFQRAIGFDTKVRQYDMGERFVADVVRQAGMAGFNRVWARPENLPTIDEVARPEAWVARVAAAS